MRMTERDQKNFARVFGTPITGHAKSKTEGDGIDACAIALARDEAADLNADEFTLRGRLRNRHGLIPPLHGWGGLMREAWHIRNHDIAESA
jgi:hypothetical protein